MLGTWLNVATVILGGTIGTLLGDRLPEKTRGTVLSGIGLMTLVIGLQMALTTHNILIVLISILLGVVIGEWIGIEDGLERLGRWVESRFTKKRPEGDSPADNLDLRKSISKAFVTASLVFCVGPMTILGSIQDGLRGDHSLLAIKSVLDGFTSMAFGAAIGPGVILSAFTVLVYQGGLSLSSAALAGSLGAVTRDNPAVIEMTATGGVLILGIGLLLLDIRKVRVANMLPAIAIAPTIVTLLKAFGIKI